jgi:hypothetical protein
VTKPAKRTLHKRATKQFQAFHDEASAPSVASSDDVDSRIAPTLEAVGLALQQVMVWRTKLGLAETSEHDPILDGKFEHLHQTLQVVEREAQAAFLHLRELSKALGQWDRYVLGMPDDVENIFVAADLIAAQKASAKD